MTEQKKSKKQTFYQFLMQQLDRDDPIGDLAADAKRASIVPKRSSSLSVWESHLWFKHACHEAMEALREAFSEYKVMSKNMEDDKC